MADELVLVFCDTEKKPHEQYEDIKRKPEGSTPVYRITYKECIQMVGHMKDFFETDVFGVEKDVMVKLIMNVLISAYLVQ